METREVFSLAIVLFSSVEASSMNRSNLKNL